MGGADTGMVIKAVRGNGESRAGKGMAAGTARRVLIVRIEIPNDRGFGRGDGGEENCTRDGAEARTSKHIVFPFETVFESFAVRYRAGRIKVSTKKPAILPGGEASRPRLRNFHKYAQKAINGARDPPKMKWLEKMEIGSPARHPFRRRSVPFDV